MCSANVMENELKYSFYRTPCLFSLNSYIFKFLINTALPASNSIYPQNFTGKTLNKINLTCKFNRWCNGAIDKVTTLHVNGPGFNSRRGKFFSFFCFCFLCFAFTIFYLLAGFNLVILLPLTTASRGVVLNLFLV